MVVQSIVISKHDLSSARLDAANRLRRKPPRPPELRQENYEERFDYLTLFFDCYRMKDGRVRFQGPPPLNLRKALDKAWFKAGPVEGRVGELGSLKLNRIRKTFFMDIELPAEVKEYTLTLENGQKFTGKINDNHCDLFQGRRVLMSMIKYDPLVWVAEWAEFYVKAHGVDAIIIFNNQATEYTSEDIALALSSVDGLEQIVVVDWMFPRGIGAAKTGYWDSAFCQVGGMAYARYRFLEQAACVINSDVDELVFTKIVRENLCDIVGQSVTGYCQYAAQWAAGPQGMNFDQPIEQRHYKNSYYTTEYPVSMGTKWVVIPDKCSEEIEWAVHRIPKMEIDTQASEKLYFRHFQELNTGWKPPRQFEGANFYQDENMVRTYRDIGWM